MDTYMWRIRLRIPATAATADAWSKWHRQRELPVSPREELEKSQEPSLLRGRHISAKAVFDAVKEGDALAVRVAERFGLYLGKALSTFASVADPQVIVIGGGVSKAGPILLDFYCEKLKKYAFSSCKETEFVPGRAGK